MVIAVQRNRSTVSDDRVGTGWSSPRSIIRRLTVLQLAATMEPSSVEKYGRGTVGHRDC